MDSRNCRNQKVCSSVAIGNPTINIPFLGRSNIWISNTFQNDEIKLAQEIIVRALNETAVGQLSIVGYDEDLSGVFAPFFSLASGDTKKLTFVSDRKQLAEQFSYFRRRIQDIQNLIQGRAASLIEFNQSLIEKNEVVNEGLVLVCLVMNMESLTDDMRSELSRFLRVGPRYGVSFLIVSPSEIESRGYNGAEIKIEASMLFPNINLLRVNDNGYLCVGNKTGRIQFMPTPSLFAASDAYVHALGSAEVKTVPFSKIENLDAIWTKNSIEGLTFCVGKYGMENMEITIGDEKNQRHNAVITGAVGTGKSNLLSVIIHSLCLHYSPDELQLFLLDFKEGVSLKGFSNLDHEEFLPQARVIGLESDISFGQSVLESLFKIYRERMILLKKYNFKSIRDLRNVHPEIVLPRIIVIIDEFQMMFEGNQEQANQTAQLLEKSVRLYRAAGIHFLLASQTLGGNTALDAIHDGLFNQIPIRIALKNSISESRQTLGVDNPHAAFLRPREAIVNLDYGEPTQNKKTVIAFADEKLLSVQRKKWWRMSKSNILPPYVFELSKTIDFSDTASLNKQSILCSDVPRAMLGEFVSITHDIVSIPLTREKGKNVAFFGLQDRDLANIEGMMQGMILSLALQYPKGNAEFLLCDFDDGKTSGHLSIDKRYPDFFSLLDRIGYTVDIVEPREVDSRLEELLETDEDAFETFFFALNMDKWDKEPAGFGEKTPLGEFLSKGPMKGKHFIGWWLKESSFNSQVSDVVSIDTIDTRIFLRINNDAVKSIAKDPLIEWTPEYNRALIWNSIEFSQERVFMPYRAISCEGLRKIRSSFEL